MKRNRYLENLSSSYLFVEIGQRKHKFLSSHPTAKVINLGVGDTTEPLPLCVAKAMEKAAAELATRDGYSGYGPFNGNSNLRRKIAKTVYADAVSMDEIYISDGSKSDIARFQNLFGPDSVIALQDPTYPAFVGSYRLLIEL
jgi:LL-diaminopimelate aminotransferase